MRSVQNIAKITSAMKMVAASKMRVAQSLTEKSRGLLTPFLKMLGDLPGTDLPAEPTIPWFAHSSTWCAHLSDPSHIKFSNSEAPKLLAAVEVEHNLVVPVSTDKGLCGGINSTVSKYARGTIAAFEGGGPLSKALFFGASLPLQLQLGSACERRSTCCKAVNIKAEEAALKEFALLRAEGQINDLVVMGEKGRAQLSRDRAKYIRETVADTQKVRITFSQVCQSPARQPVVRRRHRHTRH